MLITISSPILVERLPSKYVAVLQGYEPYCHSQELIMAQIAAGMSFVPLT